MNRDPFLVMKEKYGHPAGMACNLCSGLGCPPARYSHLSPIEVKQEEFFERMERNMEDRLRAMEDQIKEIKKKGSDPKTLNICEPSSLSDSDKLSMIISLLEKK